MENIHFTRQTPLDREARALVDFDMDSIRQMVRADHEADPAVWIVDPEGYLADGHVQRDSASIRLVAYVSESGTIYATDGCNSCRHRPEKRIEDIDESEFPSVFAQTQLPVTLLRELSRRLSASVADSKN